MSKATRDAFGEALVKEFMAAVGESTKLVYGE